MHVVDHVPTWTSLRRTLSSVTQGLNQLSDAIRDGFSSTDSYETLSLDADEGDALPSYQYQEMLCFRSVEHPKMFVDRLEIAEFLRQHVYVREDNLDYVCFEFTPLGVPSNTRCELMFRSIDWMANFLERFHCERRVFCVG